MFWPPLPRRKRPPYLLDRRPCWLQSRCGQGDQEHEGGTEHCRPSGTAYFVIRYRESPLKLIARRLDEAVNRLQVTCTRDVAYVLAYLHACVKGTCRPFHIPLRWEYSWLITTVAKCNTETDKKYHQLLSPNIYSSHTLHMFRFFSICVIPIASKKYIWVLICP